MSMHNYEYGEEYVKHPHYCALCEHVYRWSTEDLIRLYEVTPNMPCGHPWQYRRDMEGDERVFQVTTSRADDPDYGETMCYVLSNIHVAYPWLYPIVKSPGFVHLRILDEPTRTEVSVRSSQGETSQSPSHDNDHHNQ